MLKQYIFSEPIKKLCDLLKKVKAYFLINYYFQPRHPHLHRRSWRQ